MVESMDWKDLKVLDVGCGIGTTIKMLSLYGANIYGLDKSKFMLRGAEINGIQRDKLFYGDVNDISISENDFDVILLEGVIGFIKDPADTIKKLTSLLNDDGIVIVSDWEPHDRVGSTSNIEYGFHVFGNTSSTQLASSLYCDSKKLRVRVEDDQAKSFTMTLETAIKRTKAFFSLGEMDDSHIKIISNKLKSMKDALNTPITCKSYIAIFEQKELNKKMQSDAKKPAPLI